MICPFCKNEKWDVDNCPKCGLDNKEALLTKAKELKLAEKYLEAGDLLQKFIKLEPDNKTALYLFATCLSIEAIARGEVELFERARMALKEALDAEWTWEWGHQLQIDLFIFFGRQKELIKDYERKYLNDDSKKNVCERMLKIIQLTEKYKENPPMVSTYLISDLGFITILIRFWFLFLGLPLLLLGLYEVPNISLSTNDKFTFLAPFVFFILGMGIIVLILVSMNIYRKRNRNDKGKSID